jgi:diguanylate cyclase
MNMSQHVRLSPASVAANLPVELSVSALVRRAGQRRSTYLAQGASFAVDALLLLLYYFAGVTPLATSIAYFICGIAATSLWLWLSEIHFNDRFKDHYLTVPQGICSTTIQFGAIYFAPEIGIYFICIIFIVLGFGALRLTARQTGYVWTYATIGLAVLFLMTDEIITIPVSSWSERALALVCFVTAWGRTASTGLYGSAMREMLYKRGNELKTAHARIEELAQLDELTGSLNRRYILKRLNEEIDRVRRSNSSCSVAIIDLDLFKTINDRFGHPVGDETLRTFAISMFANIRSADQFGRYGGEEFLLVMPDTPKDQAVRTLDRLRQIIQELDWSSISQDMALTMSAGVCVVRHDDSAESVLVRADLALYQAKNAGRNRVIVG